MFTFVLTCISCGVTSVHQLTKSASKFRCHISCFLFTDFLLFVHESVFMTLASGVLVSLAPYRLVRHGCGSLMSCHCAPDRYLGLHFPLFFSRTYVPHSVVKWHQAEHGLLAALLVFLRFLAVHLCVVLVSSDLGTATVLL